jgi:lipid-A-disaccharide synthase
LWAQLEDDNHRDYLHRRFTDMHHTLLRDTAAESARVVLELIGQSRSA